MTTLPQSTLDAFTTLEQFRDYFAGIPEEKWCERVFRNNGGQCCARGHLGARARSPDLYSPPASDWISDKFIELLDSAVETVNDGCDYRFQQPTPRARILVAIDEANKRRDLKV